MIGVNVEVVVEIRECERVQRAGDSVQWRIV
jgi:hypothetical protein